MEARKGTSLGFTLLEAVVAVSILAIVAGLLLPAVAGRMLRAREMRAQRQMDELAQAFEAYRKDTGLWPSNTPYRAGKSLTEDLVGYSCLLVNAFGLPDWAGPYLGRGVRGTDGSLAVCAIDGSLHAGVTDPWGQPYVVLQSGTASATGAGLALLSKGPDGKRQTARDHAIAGSGAGDDLVRVVTRRL